MISNEGIYPFTINVSWKLEDIGQNGAQTPATLVTGNGSITSQDFVESPKTYYTAIANPVAGCSALDDFSVAIPDLTANAGKQTAVYALSESGHDYSGKQHVAFRRKGYAVFEPVTNKCTLIWMDTTVVPQMQILDDRDGMLVEQLKNAEGKDVILGQSYEDSVPPSSSYLYLRGTVGSVHAGATVLSVPKLFAGTASEMQPSYSVTLRTASVHLVFDAQTTAANLGKSRDGLVATLQQSLKTQGFHVFQ